MPQKDTNEWDIVISPKRKFFDISILSDLIKYKDLIFMFIKRDFVTFYKQTILDSFINIWKSNTCMEW